MELDTDLNTRSVSKKTCYFVHSYRTGSPAAKRVKKAAIIDMVYLSLVFMMACYMIYKGYQEASCDEFQAHYHVGGNHSEPKRGYVPSEMTTFGLGMLWIATYQFRLALDLYDGADDSVGLLRNLVSWIIACGGSLVPIVVVVVMDYFNENEKQQPFFSDWNWDLLNPWIWILFWCGILEKLIGLVPVIILLGKIRPRSCSTYEGNEPGIADNKQEKDESKESTDAA